MFRNLSKTKKVLIALFSIISSISIVWLFYQKGNNEQDIVIPTPIPVKFEYLKSIPSSGATSTIPATSNVEFYFSIPIDESTADVIISPEIPLSFSSDVKNKSFSIRGIPSWKVDQEYKIILKIKSKDGQELSNEIIYTFKLTKLKDSPMTEGGLR